MKADRMVADLTRNILAGLLAGDPTLPEAAAIDKAIRMARATLAALEGVPIDPTPPAARTVLTLDDFTYLGWAGLPLDEPGVTRFGFSTGALSGRVVDGQLRLIITGAQADTGWNDPVYEVAWHGAGTRCSLVANWGDVTCGRRVSAAGNPMPIHGLLWDPRTQQLLWTCLDQYNVIGAHDPCLGASTLSENGVTAAGPWRLEDHAQRVGGYLVALPEWFETQLDQRFGAGAPIGSGNASAAWGAFMAAFALPPPNTPPDGPSDPSHITIPTTHLIYSDLDHPQPREHDVDECGWTHYGETDAYGDQPQWNPVQDGRGCTPHEELCGESHRPFTTFTPIDNISAAAWIDGPTKHGLVMIGQLARTMPDYAGEYGSLGRCHVWYGPAQQFGVHKLCAHGQNDTRYGHAGTGPSTTTMQSSLFIYDPAELAKVVSGEVSPVVLPPAVDAADLSLIAHQGTPFPQLVTGGFCVYGGAWYEPTSELLFVSAVAAEWQGEWRPVIHAFQVRC